MVFLKLKQGLSFVILTILFNDLTAETCMLTYVTMIPQLAQIFQPLIYWPSKKEISSNIPYCFDSFPNVRIVLNCTEISLSKMFKLSYKVL